MSIVSCRDSSQGRLWYAYGFDVRAPTGHRSTRLPDSSVLRRDET
jgi:hypothetical protein